KIPRNVWDQLRYRPFRDFCLFNVEAEKTAWLCWQRLVDLGRTQPDLPSTLIDDFSRITGDEARHERLFQILADAVDDHDRLVAGETAESLAQKIGAVHEFFLPRSRQLVRRAGNPLGSGGRVWVTRGATTTEKLPLFRRLLDESRVADELAARAQEL